MQVCKNLVDGQWFDALDGAVLETRHPGDPDQVLGTFPSATRQDVQRAIAAAREAAKAWASTPPPDRGAILYRASQVMDARLEDSIGGALCASIVTHDLHKALAFANQIEVGVVKINESTTGLALQAPFGGFKHASAHAFKEQRKAAVEFYNRTKTIYLGYGEGDED